MLEQFTENTSNDASIADDPAGNFLLKERQMRLKILMGLMVVLAAATIFLEVQYHYIYWALASKPKEIPRFLEQHNAVQPAEVAVEVPEGTTAETTADVEAENPAESPSVTSIDAQAESEQPNP